MSIHHSLASAVVVAILAASCSGGGLSAGSYDTSCQAASDCEAVFIGHPSGCCDCPNSAINKSDDAKYEADLNAAEQGIAHCNIICNCPNATPTCESGKCGVALGDAGP